MDAHLLVLGRRDDSRNAQASMLESQSREGGIDLLWDDRTAVSAGEKLSDADLIGATIRVTMGRDTADGTVELRERRSGRVHSVSVDNALDAVFRLRKDLIIAESSVC